MAWPCVLSSLLSLTSSPGLAGVLAPYGGRLCRVLEAPLHTAVHWATRGSQSTYQTHSTYHAAMHTALHTAVHWATRGFEEAHRAHISRSTYHTAHITQHNATLLFAYNAYITYAHRCTQVHSIIRASCATQVAATFAAADKDRTGHLDVFEVATWPCLDYVLSAMLIVLPYRLPLTIDVPAT